MLSLSIRVFASFEFVVTVTITVAFHLPDSTSLAS